ncbi:MAG: low affinity iron permease family protein [Pseudomonadota bacterium]
MQKTFATFATHASKAAGSPWTFCACVLLVVAWAASGPVFGFSETWQLVINTGTTIITFLMVFLIQNTQNRDNAAIQAKLDDLILNTGAEDEFVGIEDMTEQELKALHERCTARARAHDKLHAKVKSELASRRRKSSPSKTSPAKAPARKAA